MDITTNAPVTKTQFLSYLDCKEETWMSRNMDMPRQELDPLLQLAIEDGRRVDQLAKEYFGIPGVVEQVFGAPGTVSLQETFEVEGKYKVITDVVFYPASGGPLTLVEVKGTTAKYDKNDQLKPEAKHITDLAFQQFVLEAKGVEVGRTGLLLLSRDYRYAASGISLEGLFRYGEVTKHTTALHAEIAELAPQALAFLQGPEPAAWDYTVCANKGKCKWMLRTTELPAYSIFSLNGARIKHLQGLLDQRVLDIQDVPENADLFKNMIRQVEVAQHDIHHKDQAAINAELAKLPYPHYFLDYETVSVAVPDVEGMWPYQRLAFQYSLHIQSEPGGGLLHRECLLTNRQDGMLPLLKQLKNDIPHDTGGTVIVWNKGFEKSVNKDMAETYPAYATYLNGLNDRVWDLMDVFKGSWVEHPKFYGSASIKKVLPALKPEFNYNDLAIGEGGTASYMWHLLSTGKIEADKVETLRKELLEYCEQDTMAMVVLMDWARPAM